MCHQTVLRPFLEHTIRSEGPAWMKSSFNSSITRLMVVSDTLKCSASFFFVT